MVPPALRVMFDEAAFLPEFMAAYSTVKPVAKRILAVSSAAPGAHSGGSGPPICG